MFFIYNEYMNYSRKKHFIVLGIFTIVFLFILIFNGIYRIHIKNIQKKNTSIISERLVNLEFNLNSADKDIATIDSLLELPHLSDEQNVILYNLLTNMYYINADLENYLSAFGTTLYYLKATNNTDGIVNMYSNFAKYLLQNNAYENACQIISKAEEIIPIEAIQDKATRSIAYEMLMEKSLYENNTDKALEYINKSLEDIDLFADDDPYKAMYKQMGQIALAKVLFAKGEYSEVRSIISSYETLLENRQTSDMQYLVWEFFMPVYSLKTQLALLDNDFSEALDNYAIYSDYCDYYNYPAKKIELAELMLLQLPSSYNTEINSIRNEIPVQYEKLTDFYVKQFSNIAINSFEKTVTYLEQTIKYGEQQHANITRCLFAVFIILLVLMIISILVNEAQIDSITKLPGKQALNKKIDSLQKHKTPYTVIKIDMDNFRKVNNTFGVAGGDDILRRTADLLVSYLTKDSYCYRFGGEAFVIIIKNCSITKNVHFAETIRSEIASMELADKSKITASLGVGFSSETDKVLETADANVFYAKQHGKNFTAFTTGGKIQLAEQRLGIRFTVK